MAKTHEMTAEQVFVQCFLLVCCPLFSALSCAVGNRPLHSESAGLHWALAFIWLLSEEAQPGDQRMGRQSAETKTPTPSGCLWLGSTCIPHPTSIPPVEWGPLLWLQLLINSKNSSLLDVYLKRKMYPGLVLSRYGKTLRHGNDCRERTSLYSQIPRNRSHCTQDRATQEWQGSVSIVTKFRCCLLPPKREWQVWWKRK